jgi:hypothetical protein
MRKLSAELAMLAVILAVGGCGTPQPTPRDHASVVNPDQQPTPFLGRGQYSDRVGVAVDSALKSHGFSLPWVAVRGPDGSTWFVAERFQSEHRFDRLYVQVTPENRVAASLTPYQFHASDWASLGKLFVGDTYRLEAGSIAGEITQKLAHGES